MASIALSAASNPSYDTKPKPRDAPVSGSRMIFGVLMIMPKALKVSYSSCAVQKQVSAACGKFQHGALFGYHAALRLVSGCAH